MDGQRYDGPLKEDSFRGFALAIVLFALATSLFFTPLPIFLHPGLHLPTSMVYVAYILNSVGATTGYFLIRGRAQSMNIRKQMPRFVLLRSLLIFTLVGVIWFAFSPTIMTGHSANFHRLRIRHVLHYDAFLVNGGYTSRKSRLFRWACRFRSSNRRFPWAFPCLSYLLKSKLELSSSFL